MKNNGKLIFGVRYTSLQVEEYVLIQADVVSNFGNELRVPTPAEPETENKTENSIEPILKILKVFTFNQFAICTQSDTEESDSD